MVLTNIYLLSGCGITIWLCTASLTQQNADIGMLVNVAGLLATGVGDAMGAVVGAGWGSTRHVIPGTFKSLEGSIAMFVSMVGVGSILCGTQLILSPKILLSFLICTVVEACTTTIDNLVLPMVLMTAVVLAVTDV